MSLSQPRTSRRPKYKIKNVKGTLLALIKKLRPYLIPIIIAMILSMIASILSIIGPDKLREIADLITTSVQQSAMASQAAGTEVNIAIDMEAVTGIGIFLVVIYSISAIFGYTENFMMITVINRFSQRLRRQISQKINRLPLKYFDGTTIGDVLSRVTNDVDTINESLNESIGTLVNSLTLLIGSLVMMFMTNWILAIIAIVASLIGIGLTAFILSRSQQYFIQYQRQLGTMNGHVEEVFSGHNVVRAYNAEPEVEREFDHINKDLFVSSRKSFFYSGLMMPIMNFTSNLGYVAVCVCGAMLAVNNVISFGVIVAFMLYVRFFTQPLSQFASVLTALQSTMAATERVFEFLDEPEMPSEENLTAKLDPAKVKGNVVFDNVTFGYNPEVPMIKKFSAEVKSGQKIAIVGPTGAGKTTLVNLLMKFYDIDGGDIKIDGASIHDLTRSNIHDCFTMVLQDTWLFEGSIKENIRYNRKSVTDEQIQKICRVVGLDHFIRTLPKGYNTILKDSDALSAGQKQLLTIARAMVDQSPMLILDEATSSVDTRTEELIQKSVDKLTKGRTSFIIAHRLSTIKNADMILVVRDGNIIERGNHDELMSQNGFYADLYNSQFAET